ncbi:MAG TPA: AsmA family protein, partial [Rhodocyclaceae bacterium]
MKRWIKAILVLLVGLLLLIVAVIVAAVLLFDGERVKAVLEESIAEKTGRTLQIAGVPELAIWPRLGVRLGAVSLSEKLGSAEFAGFDSANLAVAVLPLFAGELVADKVSVAGLRARLVRGEDGTLNVADLVGAPGTAGAAPAAPVEESAKPPIRFDIGGIHIDGRELSWHDRVAKQKFALRDFEIVTGRLGSGASGELRVGAELRMEAGASEEVLRVELASRYRMGDQELAFEALSGTVGGRAGGIAQLQLKLGAASVRYVFNGPIAELRDLLLDFSGEVAGLTTAATVRSPSLSWRGAGAADGVLQIPQLVLTTQAVRGPGWKADAALAGGLEMNPGMLLRLSGWKGDAGLTDSTLLQKPLKLATEFSADLDLNGPRGKVDLQFSLDESKSRVRTTLNALSPLDLVADAQLGKLDFDAYLLPPPAEASAPPANAVGKADLDPPVDLSPLAGKKVRARIESAGLKARGIVIDKALIEARLANGRLDLSPLQLAFYGGTLDGAASAVAAGNAVNTRVKLTGVDLNPLLRDLASTDLLAGRADVVADLAARGATVGAMKRALAGDLQLAVRNGALKGVNLGRSFRDLKAKFSQGATSEVAVQSDAQTDFSELTASFKVRDGVLRGDDLAAKSPFLRLGGSGEVS